MAFRKSLFHERRLSYGVRLRIAGWRASSSGRKTSDRNVTPSRVRMGTSWSMRTEWTIPCSLCPKFSRSAVGSTAPTIYISPSRIGCSKPASPVRQPVDALRGVVEQRGTLARGEALRELLELVPERGVGAGELVDGEVALEHAAVGAELLDCVQIPVAVGREQFVRGRRPLAFVPAEAVDRHLQPAHFHHHVRAGRHRGEIALPVGEHGVALAGVRPHAQRPAQVIQDDHGIGEGPREVRKLRQLRVVEPGLKAEAVYAQKGEALTEVRIEQQMRRLVRGLVWQYARL